MNSLILLPIIVIEGLVNIEQGVWVDTGTLSVSEWSLQRDFYHSRFDYNNIDSAEFLVNSEKRNNIPRSRPRQLHHPNRLLHFGQMVHRSPRDESVKGLKMSKTYGSKVIRRVTSWKTRVSGDLHVDREPVRELDSNSVIEKKAVEDDSEFMSRLIQRTTLATPTVWSMQDRYDGSRQSSEDSESRFT
ncbi:hypothetical protein RB195_019597 [Necator americanus]|uniref:Uncharacterized protein n=1 Tax=Necator americanus TaxID=51031 RepID=A0ABR1CEX6_NECAM